MGDTKIEWTRNADGTAGKTWNPIRARRISTNKAGWHCEHVTEGCRNCYAERMNSNTYFGNGLEYKPANLEQVELFLDERILEQPLRWRKPASVFVCSMTDLFGRWVKDEWIDQIFAVMALSPLHTFQVLTKRPDRMRAYINKRFVNNHSHLSDAACWASEMANAISYAVTRKTDQRSNDSIYEKLWGSLHHIGYFNNVRLGVSVEDQPTADDRIHKLILTPAAVRWISLEPMLAPVNLTSVKCIGAGYFDSLSGRSHDGVKPDDSCYPSLDWVVVGGESGPDARPCDIAWIRVVIEDCKRSGVPIFVKQLGSHPVFHWTTTATNRGFATPNVTGQVEVMRLIDKKGGDMDEWPEPFRIREFPRVTA